MSGQESFCFSTLPHHPAGRRQTCRTRLSVDKSIEATTPHGPATWLASCVLGVARRFECSEVARTAYGACASDRRSVGAWTERAPNLRGREGVNASMVSTLHSRAFCGAGFYLAKRVFPGFGSCNGHVTAITYGAELNVGGKSRTLGSVCLRILLLFCC